MAISFDDFLKVDVRVGTVVRVEANAHAKKPAYRLEVDFGPEVGVRTSSAQLTGAGFISPVLSAACI